ncbi:MAG: hypothetical protein CM1200mP40_17500 [Gammaproteobacteria bacterium]|nr:MAG: hypothetical protein CM1200mP40_17500 [Gammaproteobacteria bacterium]
MPTRSIKVKCRLASGVPRYNEYVFRHAYRYFYHQQPELVDLHDLQTWVTHTTAVEQYRIV